MTLSAGGRVGPYEIVSVLGAGGMGEVYRAHDPKLNRDVALKVLPELFATNQDRLVRFKREAQVLASLNHPNIAAIYGFEEWGGVQALVLELVEGPTLAERIRRGPVPLDESLPIATQIAEALAAAHEQGIIHRDLKPANIKLRPDGAVKILDFGLAKALDSAADLPAGDGDQSPDVRALPTITSATLTRTGVILGTVAYMSPEQAKGRPADRRSDLWAFGCVLYEMLTGKRAFEDEDVSNTSVAAMRSEPDWHALPRETPDPVRRLLRRCLVKDPKSRIADASSARLEIDDALAPKGSAEGVAVPAAPRRLWQRAGVAWSAASAILLGAIALGAFAYFKRAADDAPVVRTIIPTPDGTFLDAPNVLGSGLPLALSPDGRRLVFVATGSDSRSRLWLRSLDGNQADALVGTDGGTCPFWSPDGRSIAFFTPADHKLKRVDLGSDRVVTISEDPDLYGGGGTWNADGVILFAPNLTGSGAAAIYRVAASGGTPMPVTAVDAKADERHVTPFFLPDGRHFLYTSVSKTGPPSVSIGSINESQTVLLLRDAGNVQTAEGRLLFMRGATLVAQPFDVKRLVTTGAAVPIVEGIVVNPLSRTGSFSVSATGVLAYPAAATSLSELTWFDRAGNRIGTLGEPAGYNTVNLSPDGSRAAISLRGADGNVDIWLVDVARRVRTRFTFDPSPQAQGVWSPDGNRLVFDTARSTGQNALVVKAADGSGAEDVIDASPRVKFANSWSPDGQFVLYGTALTTPRTGSDVWVVPLSNDRKPYPVVQTSFNEGRAQFAPDGRWIAYQSNESARNEVYVAPFPASGGKWQVSTAGGDSPRWRRDGKELFYIGADGMLMAAAVNSRSSILEVGTAFALFNPRIRDQRLGVPYDVTADGQRFLVNTLPEHPSPSSITLIVNWAGLLRK